VSKSETKTKSGSFTKAQFLMSQKRSGVEKDILAAVMEEGKTYTLAEAEKLISEFKKGKVK